MGKAECRNYIEKVTQVYCADMDARISNMLRDYDADHDGYTNCQDFLAFYRDSLLDPEKSEAVEKNLVNLRFRKDLCRYDEPLAELDETKLFRYYLCRNNEVYDMLFALINHPNTDIHAQAERLLMRLPTYSRIREQLNCKISFSDKSPFEKEYILTAIQGLLSY